MNLLPKDKKDFSSKEYWNEFFSKLKTEHFEWYGEYSTLGDVIDKYTHVKDKVLIVGCGNSKLSADLYDVGICNSVSIDINAQVINQMNVKYKQDRSKMVFEEMDVCQMSYEEESFAVVIDKGTLDALFVDESDETMEKINKMLSEIDRVLRKGGRYLCISLLQDHILNKILDHFLEKGWFVRIHRCLKAESEREDSLMFPVFICVLTKMKKIPGAHMVLELAHDPSTQLKRCSSKKEVLEYVQSAQHYAFLKHYMNKKLCLVRKLRKEPPYDSNDLLNARDSANKGMFVYEAAKQFGIPYETRHTKLDEDICLELCDPVNNITKYRMFVVDRKEPSKMKFALFVVPQGREIEWLFSTPEGRLELATSANCERLIVVHLMRNLQYDSLEEVQDDLSAKVLELAPHSLNSQVPILSLGADVGHREVKCSARSEISGDYVVEDVLSTDNAVYRRLIFLNNPYLVQSEAKLIKTVQKKKKKNITKYDIDFDYLACDHHVAIISGLAFLENNMFRPKVLLIGLGGGTLAMYLYKHFPEAHIDVVELDPIVVDIAKKWFSLATDERLKIHVADGLDFIKDSMVTGVKYNAVILDVDSKNPSLGISSPPVTFLEDSVLSNICDILNSSGILLMNLACRNADLRLKTYSKVKQVFKCIYSRNIPAEVNEVLYCTKAKKSANLLNILRDDYSKLIKFLEAQTKSSEVFKNSSLIPCLSEIT